MGDPAGRKLAELSSLIQRWLRVEHNFILDVSSVEAVEFVDLGAADWLARAGNFSLPFQGMTIPASLSYFSIGRHRLEAWSWMSA